MVKRHPKLQVKTLCQMPPKDHFCLILFQREKNKRKQVNMAKYKDLTNLSGTHILVFLFYSANFTTTLKDGMIIFQQRKVWST